MTARQMQVQEDLVAAGVPEDRFIREFFAACYADAEATGTPLPPPSREQTSHAFIFPNITFVQELGNALMFRSRPNGDDPHSCVFDFWSLSVPPAGSEVPRPTNDADMSDLWFLQQDIGNIERQQAGIRTRGHDASRLSLSFEPIITNFHLALDRVLSGLLLPAPDVDETSSAG